MPWTGSSTRDFSGRFLSFWKLVKQPKEGLNVFHTGNKEIVNSFETITEQLLSALSQPADKSKETEA